MLFKTIFEILGIIPNEKFLCAIRTVLNDQAVWLHLVLYELVAECVAVLFVYSDGCIDRIESVERDVYLVGCFPYATARSHTSVVGCHLIGMCAASVYHDDACAISLIVRCVGGEVENDVSEHFVANTVGESCHGLFVSCIDGLHGIIISALWKRLPVAVSVTTLLKVGGQFRPCLFIGCVGRGKAIDVVAYAILYGFQWSCWLCSLHLVVVLIIVERGLFIFVLLHVARHETSRLCDVVLGHTVRSAYGADHKVAMHVLALLVVQIIIGA